MQIVREYQLTRFARRNPNTRESLNRWTQLMRDKNYKNIIELRETFGRVSAVKVKPRRFGQAPITLTVFNISGNDARLIAVVNYVKQTVYIDQVLTHAEYDSGNWRN